jgi:hypothetical protein
MRGNRASLIIRGKSIPCFLQHAIWNSDPLLLILLIIRNLHFNMIFWSNIRSTRQFEKNFDLAFINRNWYYGNSLSTFQTRLKWPNYKDCLCWSARYRSAVFTIQCNNSSCLKISDVNFNSYANTKAFLKHLMTLGACTHTNTHTRRLNYAASSQKIQ